MSRLGVESPVRVGGAIVIPVYWQRITTLWLEDAACLHGERSAAAVVVKSGDDVRAFAVDGAEWDVNTLAAAVPALAEVLSSLRK